MADDNIREMIKTFKRLAWELPEEEAAKRRVKIVDNANQERGRQQKTSRNADREKGRKQKTSRTQDKHDKQEMYNELFGGEDTTVSTPAGSKPSPEGFSLGLDSPENIVRGIIMSEILSPPPSVRRVTRGRSY